MPDIIVVGSLNMDLVAAVARLPAPGETVLAREFHTICGGKGGNQAVAAGRLGGSVGMVGRVGQDSFGAALLDGLSTAGVDISGVGRVAGPSGVALIGASGPENLIMVAAGANAALGPEALDAEKLRAARVVLCQLEVPLATVEHLAALLEGWPAVFVLDPAPAAPLPDELLRRVDWLTPNETEAATLLGRAGPVDDPAATADALRALGPRNIALKLGARGVFIRTDEAAALVSPPTVAPVDTTAAGDAFNGAFAVALAEGAAPLEAARFGCAAAAWSVTRFGAQPAMPTRAEAISLLA